MGRKSEGIRFERMGLLHPVVFKTTAIDHSANPLNGGCVGFEPHSREIDYTLVHSDIYLNLYMLSLLLVITTSTQREDVSFLKGTEILYHLVLTATQSHIQMEPCVGIEPTTYCLQNSRTTAVLTRQSQRTTPLFPREIT